MCRHLPRILPCWRHAVPASDVYYSRCPTHDGREGYGRRPVRTSRVGFEHTVRSAGRYSGACEKQRTNCGMSRDPGQILKTGDIAAGDQDRMPVRDRCRGSGQDMQRRLVGGPDMAGRPDMPAGQLPGVRGQVSRDGSIGALALAGIPKPQPARSGSTGRSAIDVVHSVAVRARPRQPDLQSGHRTKGAAAGMREGVHDERQTAARRTTSGRPL